MSSRYRQSEVLLEKALKVIPLGTQTFSKSKTQYPFGVSPYFIRNGIGSRVWDADGNEYVDFVNGLASVTLGYSDPDVSEAVLAQLDGEGPIFSLPHPIEIEVAELLVDLVPCAEMVRFGKNGSDATAGAIRVARSFTDRDHVAVCGYHGWQDWYIGSTARYKGVPAAVRELTHTFRYNDLESLAKILETWPGQVAAVILEPMNVEFPTDGFLQGVVDLAHDHGAVSIFDETITGFRFGLGGAQEYFGVTPDLCTLGKGIANGYPLSAVAGRRDIMQAMEEVFFSFTFGGETFSLAAAAATLKKLRQAPVVEHLRNLGTRVADGTRALIEHHGLTDMLAIKGHPSWSFLIINPDEPPGPWVVKTYLMQELLAAGILTLGTHNISYAHNQNDVERLLAAYDETFSGLKSAIRTNSLQARLRCAPLEPLFKVR